MSMGWGPGEGILARAALPALRVEEKGNRNHNRASVPLLTPS